MRKRRILAAALILLVVCAFALRDSFVRLYVRLNSGALEDFALAALEDGAGKRLSYGPWDAAAWQQAGVVEFYTRRSFAFGGVEKGFYYSKGDTPVSFQAAGYPLTEDGSLWRWADPYGNHGTTERILPCWFWYEAVL